MCIRDRYGPYRLTMWIVRTIAVIPAVMVCLIGIKKLGQGGEEISKGNFDYQVDTRFMFGEIKEIGQDMNSRGAVSYTHLDGYKRQPLILLGFPAEFLAFPR